MKIVQKVGQEVSSHREVEDEFAGVVRRRQRIGDFVIVMEYLSQCC